MSEAPSRFGGLARLLGQAGLDRLRQAHVCVVGLGGVGSWAAEALARSSIGTLTLIDLDDVCISNINRQLPALDDTVGQPKVSVMAGRIRGINPDCQVHACLEFFTEATAERLLAPPYTHVLDAIDSVANKVRLIVACTARGLPLTVCGGAGGRRDPTAVRLLDLSRVTHDRLLREVRKRLRQDHGYPGGDRRFGLDCVCSAEPPVFPQPDGSVCATRSATAPGESMRLNCDRGFGSASFVTGTFGFVAASHVVRRIIGETAHAR